MLFRMISPSFIESLHLLEYPLSMSAVSHVLFGKKSLQDM